MNELNNNYLLTNEELKNFLSNFDNIELRRKEIFNLLGKNKNTIYYIKEGSILENCFFSYHDKNQVLSFYKGKNNFVGCEYFFKKNYNKPLNLKQEDNKKHFFITREPCLLYEIPLEQLYCLLNSTLKNMKSKIIFHLSCELSANYKDLVNTTFNIAYCNIEGKTFNVIKWLAQTPCGITHPNGIMIKISRIELSKITGNSRENTGKALKSLENKNLIKTFGKTIILIQ